MNFLVNRCYLFKDKTISTSRYRINKNKEGFLIELVLTEFSKEEVNIYKEENYLFVKAEKEESLGRDFLIVKESFYLGENTDLDKICSDFKDGILYIKINKL
tara:strand:+ start:14659 stop:14964 length:306 start_codon:yes stop_codon:yes gene_type:complete